MPSVTFKEAPGAVPPATKTPVSSPSTNPLPSSQDPDTLTSHDYDVNMADSTFTFKNTMHMDDLGGGAVTPPTAATSVPILVELAKDIEDEPKAPSCTIADPEMGTYDLLTRPIGTHETLSSQVTIRFPLVPIRTQDTHDRTLRATKCARFLLPHQLR